MFTLVVERVCCAVGLVGFVLVYTFGPIRVCPWRRRVRSVHSRAPRGSSDLSGAFDVFLCALWSSGSLECFRPIPVRPGGRKLRSVHSRTPWGSLLCVRSARPGNHRVRSCAFSPFPCAQETVGFVRARSVVRPRCPRVHSCALCPFPGVVLFIRVLSVDSRAPCRSSGSFCSIPVRHGGHRLCSVQCFALMCALAVVGFVRVRSFHSRTPWVS